MELKTLIKHAPPSVKENFIHRHHLKGESILYADETNNYLYILTEGKADVIFQSFDGAMQTVYNYQPHSCFGELELFNEKARTYDVISKTDCETICLHKDFVFAWMKEDFEMTRYLFEQLTTKLLSSAKSLSTLTLLNVNDRFLNCIYTYNLLGELNTLTKETICTKINTPIRSLNRAIAQCKDMGYVKYEKKEFIILDAERLEAYCETLL